MRHADDKNLEIVADRAAESEYTGSDGLPLLHRDIWEQDAMAAISLETFFPGDLRGVDGADKVNAGELRVGGMEGFDRRLRVSFVESEGVCVGERAQGLPECCVVVCCGCRLVVTGSSALHGPVHP